MWIRPELMSPKNGRAFLNPALSVCLGMNCGPRTQEEFHPPASTGDIPVALDINLLKFLESNGGQMPAAWQSKTIQSP